MSFSHFQADAGFSRHLLESLFREVTGIEPQMWGLRLLVLAAIIIPMKAGVRVTAWPVQPG